MANEEARALLDALMGADRNAPLPTGAALPRKNGRDSSGQLLLPGKRHKSCYDRDIDPLYTAWGIDVYDLFVNTKSDLGTNPYIVDEGAHEEFKKLPPEEQDRLGFNYFLFQKLQDLVRQCDRTVARNKEKLRQELNRKLAQRGGQDFVEDVDDAAVDMLVRSMVQVEDLKEELDTKLKDLESEVAQENDHKQKLEPLLQLEKEKKDNVADENDASETNPVKEEPNEENQKEMEAIQMELGRLTLKKQRTVYELGRIVGRLASLQESVETQHRNLNYVKSDISTDKTVCEVSGNFMSARDADERIAAHYAGKQYVGWKLVRDKYNDLVKKYGRYGPPPPGSAPADTGGGDARGFHGGRGFDRGPGWGRGNSGGYGRPDRGERYGRGGPSGGGCDDRGPPRGRWRR